MNNRQLKHLYKPMLADMAWAQLRNPGEGPRRQEVQSVGGVDWIMVHNKRCLLRARRWQQGGYCEEFTLTEKPETDKHGAISEVDMIVNHNEWRWYFYGWGRNDREDPEILAWGLFDLDVFREWVSDCTTLGLPVGTPGRHIEGPYPTWLEFRVDEIPGIVHKHEGLWIANYMKLL